MHTLTRKRDLRKAEPLWADTPRHTVRTQKRVPAHDVDVLIVGAGISGALMANALIGHKLRILMVDRRKPISGSSMASTAMIQHEIDVPLHQLNRVLGAADAARIWQRSAKAVEHLASLVDGLQITCQFERKSTLFLSGSSYGARALQAEVEARGAAKLEATLLPQADLRSRFDIDRTAAIETRISASANPAQLTSGFLRHAQANDIPIVENVEITDIREIEGRNAVATSDGQIIAATHVVFCTGYEFLEAVAHKNHAIVSTWALATKPRHPRPEWLDDYLVWEGADPYLYFRSTKDGRIIVGGEDEKSDDAFRDPAKLKAKSDILREKLSDLIGVRIGEPDYRWAAAFGVTAQGLPMIGRVPGMRNAFATMGYGGNGITFSQIAAEIISSSILGHADPDASLFPFV
ncbi:Gamma-glutamylputrescine oxidoreductase [Ensifer sp. M14]|uniref:NAD(P)/FAD-dependent oxidoreductase n=1 Tax=Ensifer sp. M14 TaxID=2203782 RepID=UPI000E1D47C6|nr:FAD-binding oxidoreductase [Ensifer sp. M14]RDL46985.1 Gamma-glutamylputrescine oxidoreductase [Ensifer sp. M14]